MCIVTYIPKDNDDFILTHNRDEHISRPLATPPIERKINGINHLFPIDPQGRGSWIGISESGRFASLLNGGSEPYVRRPPYRFSRGKVVLDYFAFPTFEHFYNNSNFQGLEPFTLLVIENLKMFELVVNESNTSVKELERRKPYIYFSSTLYNPSYKEDRSLEFFQWYYNEKKISQENLLQLHQQFLYEKVSEDSTINGDRMLHTVSITSVDKNAGNTNVHYYDLINDIHLKKSLLLEKPLFEQYK